MSVPSSPTHFPAQDGHAVLTSPPLPRTRTIAIVKNHALPYLLDIEPRISGAGFEVCELRTYPAWTRLIYIALADCERETDGI